MRMESPGNGNFGGALPGRTSWICQARNLIESYMDGEKSNPVTVLLVDDDSAVCFAVGMGLVMRGFTVLEAYSADDAMRVCLTHHGKIEAAVIDLEMPKIWGHELANRMRTILPDMPIVYISGHSREQMVNRGVMSGHEPFFEKPFKFDDLATRLRELLAEGRNVALRPAGDQPQSSRAT
jgi:DNA-binding response OmpR family regulator